MKASELFTAKKRQTTTPRKNSKLNVQYGGLGMIKVKTFVSPLKIFHARKELEDLDSMVNKFIEENKVQKVVSVSDSCTSDDSGTIGLIRVVAYE